ncbi:MAG: GGDEF domain-containing protein [Burkholderiaceae bacterium]
MIAHPPQAQTGFVKQLWLAAAAIVLLAIGVGFGLQTMAHDHEVALRHRDALQVSKAALELQRASENLRSVQARITHELLSSGGTEGLSLDRAALNRSGTELRALVAASIASDTNNTSRTQLLELGNALDTYVGVLARSTTGNGSGATVRDRVIDLQRRFETVEQRLASVISDTHTRTTMLEREADEYAARKRITRIAFIVITLLAITVLITMSVRTMRSNSKVLDRLAQLAQEDPLTGIPNRRGLDEMFPVEFARARRNGLPLTFVMLDLDLFKRYNDRRGHAAGDALLRGAAQAWSRQLRPTDLIARYGGEEFSLLLPACDSDQAALLVDRMRGLVPDHQTFSAGIATWDQEESAPEVMQRADQALLQAKKAGRNRSMIAGREPQVTLPLMHA